MIDVSTHTRKIWRSHFDGADSTILSLIAKINRFKFVTALLMSKVLPMSKVLLTSKVPLFFIDFYLVK
jgi:hypothetical protein